MAHDESHHIKRVIPTERSAGGTWCYECGTFLERARAGDEAEPGAEGDAEREVVRGAEGDAGNGADVSPTGRTAPP